jgi:hypothetical protein
MHLPYAAACNYWIKFYHRDDEMGGHTSVAHLEVAFANFSIGRVRVDGIFSSPYG